MRREEVQLQQLITNGIVAAYIVRRSRQGGGYDGITYRIRRYDPRGVEMFISDTMLSSWYPVPWDWSAVPGQPLEEKYTIDPKQVNTLHRETRALDPTPGSPGSTLHDRRLDVLRGVMAKHPYWMSTGEIAVLFREAGADVDLRTVKSMLFELYRDGWAARSRSGWKRR